MPSNPKTGAAAPIETTRAPFGGLLPSDALMARAAAASNAAITAGPSSGPDAPGTGPGGGPAAGGTGGPAPAPGGGPSGSGPTAGSSGSGNGGTAQGTTQADQESVFNSKISETFISLIDNATSADALAAQNIILRRIALQGDVVPSRVPPPRNITEIGGYLNLLTNLNQTDMQAQVLAGILGVAGPNPPLGWLSDVTPLSFVALANDRPAGPAQPTIPVTVSVRSDFADALRNVLKTLHDRGCLLPFLGTPTILPPAVVNAVPPADPLPYLGRVLFVASATALVAPNTDALVLARDQGTTSAFQLAANVVGPAVVPVSAANYQALVCTAAACTPVPLTAWKLVYVAPLLAAAGFYPPSPPQQPVSNTDNAWARLTNVTGLVAGTTRLGDELALLYSWASIHDSVFAGRLGWTWDGLTFTP